MKMKDTSKWNIERFSSVDRRSSYVQNRKFSSAYFGTKDGDAEDVDMDRVEEVNEELE